MTAAAPGALPAGPAGRRPLHESIAALPATERLAVRSDVPAEEPGWTTTADLQAADALEALLARVHGNVCALVPAGTVGDVPDTVAPAYVLGWYLAAVASAAAVPFVHARRVPGLRADRVALRLSDVGWPDAVAVLSPRFACLPDDPDAGHRDADPVADLEALRTALRAELAEHATGFLAAWGRRGRRGRHALWGFVSDALVDAVWEAAPGEVGAREAAAVLPPRGRGRLAPFVGTGGFRSFARPDGTVELVRSRVSCCLAYAVPGAEVCLSCPRIDDAERARRVRTP